MLGETKCQELPTNYEYYTEGGITSGVEPLADGFRLNTRNITIHSGAMHYFRIHPAYWRDRLRKLRAGGANAVETYVPWNLHEPSPGKYDFGGGNEDMSPFLDIVSYIRIAQEEDLLVIVRPGPYICAEWEFGGMPSWLLRDRNMRLRTSDPSYEEVVDRYFSQLLPLFVDLQFTNGGPIIAFQIENEYGNYKNGNEAVDQQHLINLQAIMSRLGLKEMFFTSDTPTNSGSSESFVPSVLRTANFKENPEVQLNMLKLQQPDKPAMVMEYWTGWFDHWLETVHQHTSVEVFSDVLERILKFPSSVNLYMYHGGTNWGFLNGANVDTKFPFYEADVTSYDYDAPLSEAGDYTEKYEATRQLFDKYNPVKTKLPAQPAESVKMAYPPAQITGQIQYSDFINQIPSSDRFRVYEPINMESLPANADAGQSYGYIVYRKANIAFLQTSVLNITGKVHDIATVIVDGETKTLPLTDIEQIREFGYWIRSDAELSMEFETPRARTLDILVENIGRNNFGVLPDFDQRKGIWEGPVFLDGVEITAWEAIMLQFKGDWVRSLLGWSPITSTTGPALYQASFSVIDPHDTFLDMRTWGKGNVFINGFNLGRYWNMGPPRSLYLPAPLLRVGLNKIVIFEQFLPSTKIVFSETPILGDIAQNKG